MRLRMIALVLAAAARDTRPCRGPNGDPSEDERGRHLLHPRRLRAPGGRRARRARHARRAGRRRPRLFADPGRRAPRRRGQAGLHQRARLRGLDEPPRQILRHQGRDRRGRQRHRDHQDGRTRPACHGHGSVDPHAWQSVANAKLYVAHIRDALVKADPAGREVYERNAADYLARLEGLEEEVKATIARIPAERRKVIMTHDAFGYFERDLRARLHRPAGRLDGGGSLGQGRGAHHPADPAREDPGGVPGERLRPAPDRAHRRGDRRPDRRPPLFRRPVRRGRPGRHLHRHDATQYKGVQRGAVA